MPTAISDRVRSPEPRCGSGLNPLDTELSLNSTPPAHLPLAEFLNKIDQDPIFARALAHHERLPQVEAIYGDTAEVLPDCLISSLRSSQIERLYSHQAKAIDLIKAGNSIVAVTPTASGKSLMYNLPVMEKLSREPSSHAIYLFPLKALEQDQAQKLSGLIRAAKLDAKVTVGIYDGDTPSRLRMDMRKNPPSILITNPDMLHLAIMGYHSSWEDLLRGLRFIVLDELHVYRGIFGSHILHLLHRLIRLCRFYGANPQVIATSATIAEADRLASKLTGLNFELIEASGAPVSKRHFLFFNPEESYLTFALRLFTTAMQAGLKVIAFTKARRTTELLHRWLNETHPDMAAKVSSYRAGFLPEERREIEKQLQTGKLQGVISTSALELGIDIGGLDVCVMVGYPGTISATWQRAGRVGRSERSAAVCLVAGRDQLDQYFMKHPDDFFARSVECAVVDDTNDHIVRQHLLCAAQEIPILKSDPEWGEPAYGSVITELAGEGKLLQAAAGDRWFASLRRPQRKVNVRSIGGQYSIELEGKGKSGFLGTVSGRSVFAECHPGAIYLHRAKQYQIIKLDLEEKKVIARQTNTNHYTTPLFQKDTEILDELASQDLPQGNVKLVRLKVTEQLIAYQKRRVHTQELISQHELEYPPHSYETVGLAVSIPEQTAELAAERGLHFRGGIHGLEHATLALAPLFALCDRNDMGGYSTVSHPQVGTPAVFLYDGHPGGIGLSVRLMDIFPELLKRTLSLVSECECEVGCPSCIHSPKCGHGNIPLDKRATVLGLEVLTGAQQLPIPKAVAKVENIEIKIPASKEDSSIESIEKTVETKSALKRVMPPNWPADKSCVVFDLETQRSAEEVGGWGNIPAMGLAWGVVYRFPGEEWLDFDEAHATDLVEALKSADLVVGFNSIGFDYAVLRAYSGYDFRLLPSYDILAEIVKSIGHRLKLNSVAEATIGAKKTADGLQSLQWWRDGDVEKVARYCRKDVEITRDVFFHILEKRYLLFDKKGIGLARVPMPLPFSSSEES